MAAIGFGKRLVVLWPPDDADDCLFEWPSLSTEAWPLVAAALAAAALTCPSIGCGMRELGSRNGLSALASLPALLEGRELLKLEARLWLAADSEGNPVLALERPAKSNTNSHQVQHANGSDEANRVSPVPLLSSRFAKKHAGQLSEEESGLHIKFTEFCITPRDVPSFFFIKVRLSLKIASSLTRLYQWESPMPKTKWELEVLTSTFQRQGATGDA